MNVLKPNKRIILHITPHFGGGVGRVLLNYLEKVKGDPDFSFKVLSLEYANEKALLASEATGFELKDRMSQDHDGILSAIAEADIVLVHWWNHPLLYAFLVREILPPCRMIFWSHISGFHAPYVFTKPALYYPDFFVFTSPLSMETPEVKALDDKYKQKLRVIWSTGGIEHVAAIRPRPHEGFKIGYIGTVDYSKMHRAFLRMSCAVNIPDVRFIVCGGPNERHIYEEAVQLGMENRIVFTGQVSDITEYLSEFDVFGYPLASDHWGTCEQSLCESMAAGVPPVVLANKTESYIVEDGVTGIVAQDEDAYVKAVEKLYSDPVFHRKISSNARKAARRRFSMEKMVDSWGKLFHEALGFPKLPRQWTGKHQGKSVLPHQIFLESLGGHQMPFWASLSAQTQEEKEIAAGAIRNVYAVSQVWQTKTRGTPRHYSYFFPEDDYLILWSSWV